MKPSAGDIRCTALGHITRMAIWQLRPSWDSSLPTESKLSLFRRAMDDLATVRAVIEALEGVNAPAPVMAGPLFALQDVRKLADAVAF
jgi:hypothetical protein